MATFRIRSQTYKEEVADDVFAAILLEAGVDDPIGPGDMGPEELEAAGYSSFIVTERVAKIWPGRVTLGLLTEIWDDVSQIVDDMLEDYHAEKARLDLAGSLDDGPSKVILADPSFIGSSEYRAVHDLLEDCSEDCPPGDWDDMALQILSNVVQHSENIARQFRLNLAAKRYLKTLRRDLGKVIYDRCVELKRSAGFSNVCAFHNVVDANMWMSEAAEWYGPQQDFTDADATLPNVLPIGYEVGMMTPAFTDFCNDLCDRANALLKAGYVPPAESETSLRWTRNEAYHIAAGMVD